MKSIPLLLLIAALEISAQQPQAQPGRVQSRRPTPRPPIPDEKLGSVSGSLVDAISGMPLPKATVQISAAGTNGTNNTAVTDLNGQFTFEQVPPGRVTLSVMNNPAFMQRRQPAAKVLELAASERQTGIKLTLQPPGAISGRITDENGDPPSTCYVSVQRLGLYNDKTILQSVGGARTSASGEYRIESVDAGGYYVRASCSAPPSAHPLRPVSSNQAIYPEDTYVPDYYPGVASLASATRVKMSPGAEVRGIDFKLRKERSYVVSGRVLAPQSPDQPSSGFQAMLYKRGELDDAMSVSSARINPTDNRFQIRRVLPGSYTLVVQAMNPGSPLYVSTPVDVGKESPPELTLSFPPPVTIQGKVEWLDEKPDTSTNKQPLAFSYTVSAQRGPMKRVMVGPDGSFRMENVPAARVTLMFPIVPPQTYIQSITWGEEQLTAPEFQVTPGATGPLTIRLSNKCATVRGTVQQDRPATASVVLIPTGSKRIMAGQPLVFPIYSGNNYGFGAIPPGRYRICAVEGVSIGYEAYQDPDLQKVILSMAEDIEVTEGASLTKDLKLIMADVIDEAMKQQ